MTEKLRWLITFTFNYTHFQRLQKVTQMTRRRHSPLYLSGHVSGQASDLVTTLRKLLASGSFAPWPQQGLCPWTRWGHSPQTPMHSPRCLFHPNPWETATLRTILHRAYWGQSNTVIISQWAVSVDMTQHWLHLLRRDLFAIAGVLVRCFLYCAGYCTNRLRWTTPKKRSDAHERS